MAASKDKRLHSARGGACGRERSSLRRKEMMMTAGEERKEGRNGGRKEGRRDNLWDLDLQYRLACP